MRTKIYTSFEETPSLVVTNFPIEDLELYKEAISGWEEVLVIKTDAFDVRGKLYPALRALEFKTQRTDLSKFWERFREIKAAKENAKS